MIPVFSIPTAEGSPLSFRSELGFSVAVVDGVNSYVVVSVDLLSQFESEPDR